MDLILFLILYYTWPVVAVVAGGIAAYRFGWFGITVVCLFASIVGAFALTTPVMSEQHRDVALSKYAFTAAVIFVSLCFLLTPVHLYKQKNLGASVGVELGVWGVIAFAIVSAFGFIVWKEHSETLKYSVSFVGDARFPMIRTEYQLETAKGDYRYVDTRNDVRDFYSVSSHIVAWSDRELRKINVTWYSVIDANFYRVSLTLPEKHYKVIDRKMSEKTPEPAYHYFVVLYPKGHVYVLARYGSKYSMQGLTTIAHSISEPFEGDLSSIKWRHDGDHSSAEDAKNLIKRIKQRVKDNIETGKLAPVSPEELLQRAEENDWRLSR